MDSADLGKVPILHHARDIRGRCRKPGLQMHGFQIADFFFTRAKRRMQGAQRALVGKNRLSRRALSRRPNQFELALSEAL